jgi:hypothetical protein
MSADLAYVCFGVAVAALMGWNLYRLGYATGRLDAQGQALRELEAGRAPFAWPPEDATPEESFAWSVDCAERGPEYADGQLAYRRARGFGEVDPKATLRSRNPELAEAIDRLDCRINRPSAD